MKKAANARESNFAAFQKLEMRRSGRPFDSSPLRQLTQPAATDYILLMATLTIELPPHAAQTHYNLRRWAEVLADRELARVEGRIETDRHGQIIMSPPPAPNHGSLQSRISHLLQTLLQAGRTLTECPISTSDGVKAADVAWASPECMRELGNRICFPRAPEICVEILSPSNSKAEMNEKKLLYFDAGATEVWICSNAGIMSFFSPSSPECLRASRLCSQFPKRITLS
jgi:Uma2 family endonuclease